jgi:hypothetical protein
MDETFGQYSAPQLSICFFSPPDLSGKKAIQQLQQSKKNRNGLMGTGKEQKWLVVRARESSQWYKTCTD